MARLRMLFVVLALLLALPLTFLGRQVVRNLELERSLRHRSVAERIFDELEGELGLLLRREEDRPYAHYRHFFVPDASVAQGLNLTRSPLAEPPTEPFVIGYFQVEPEGTVSSPLEPRNRQLAAAKAGWSPDPEVAASVEQVRLLLADFWHVEGADDEKVESAGPSPGSAGPSPGNTGPSPGNTVQVAPAGRRALTAAEGDGAKTSSRGFLDPLNRRGRAPKERPSKVSPSQAQSVYDFARETEQNVLQQALSIETEAIDPLADDDDGAAAEASRSSTLARLNEDIERTLNTEATSTVEVRLEPLVGRLAAAERLVLYRTVLLAGRAYRQGLVIDTSSLVAWLWEQLAAGGGLVERTSLELEAAAVPAADAYTYRHRFADPFASVVVQLSLPRLPDPSGSLYLYALLLLLALGSATALLALYRMVAAKVGFAERRSNFVNAVTHELKTPLTSIRMYGEMLRDGVVPDEAKRHDYSRRITAESERLSRLLENVLELSRIEQKQAGRLELGDPTPVLREAVTLLEPRAEGEGFRLQLEVESDLRPVTFDRDALKQVLFNLVDNALKYSRAAERREIRLFARADGEAILIGVRDHGPGVSRRHLKRVFEPFFRGESELTRTAKGTGLGLALVRGLVERMGGQLSARNAEGGGFEVRVLLKGAAS